MSDVDPIIGNWYHNEETGAEFEVVALDEEAQTIEIQYTDGEVEELELDGWYDLPVEMIDTPKDWTGPFDGLGTDDLDYDPDQAERDGLDEMDELSDEDDLSADQDED